MDEHEYTIVEDSREVVEEVRDGLWLELDLGKRQKKMLESGYMADYTIKVQNSTFQCHKSIIGASSPIFDKLIRKNPNTLQLQNVDSTDFRFLLEIIYCGENDELIDIDDTLRVGKISLELQIYPAVACCAKILGELVQNPKGLFRAIDFVHLTQNNDLKESCIKIIQEQTDLVLSSDEFINCSFATLEMIISQDALHYKVSELDLFLACARWANARENPREALGSALRYIRFRLLTAKDFAKDVKPTKLLTTQEENSLIDYFLTGEGNIPEGFSNDRNRTKLYRSDDDYDEVFHPFNVALNRSINYLVPNIRGAGAFTSSGSQTVVRGDPRMLRRFSRGSTRKNQ